MWRFRRFCGRICRDGSSCNFFCFFLDFLFSGVCGAKSGERRATDTSAPSPYRDLSHSSFFSISMITYDHHGIYLYYKEQIYNTREFYGAPSFGCERACGIFGVSLLFSQSMIALRFPLSAPQHNTLRQKLKNTHPVPHNRTTGTTTPLSSANIRARSSTRSSIPPQVRISVSSPVIAANKHLSTTPYV